MGWRSVEEEFEADLKNKMISVTSPIGKGVLALPVGTVIDPVAYVFIAIGPFLGTLALLSAIDPIPLVTITASGNVGAVSVEAIESVPLTNIFTGGIYLASA